MDKSRNTSLLNLVLSIMLAFFIIWISSCDTGGEQRKKNSLNSKNHYLFVPDEYEVIQEAIDAAKEGDTVIVKKGIYKENLHIEKNVVLASDFIWSKKIEDIQKTIIDGQRGGHVISLLNTDIAMEIIGFTIQNGDDGIIPKGKMNFHHNIVRFCNDGIDYETKSGGVCFNNIFEQNKDDGIDLDEDTDVIISKNIIRNNEDDGIEIRFHPFSGDTLYYEISYNIIENHGENGIQVIDYPDTSTRRLLIRNNIITHSSMAAIGFMDNGNTKEDYRAAVIPEQVSILNNTIDHADYGFSGNGRVLLLNNSFSNIYECAIKGLSHQSSAAYLNLYHVKKKYLECDTPFANIYNMDPGFESGGYALNANSHLIDAGVSVFSNYKGPFYVNHNYSGLSPDIGAVEYDHYEWIDQVGIVP